MGVQPHISYERVYAMGHAVLPKLRKLLGGDSLAWNDREFGNILDMAVDKQIRAKNVEEWWEDDWAFGINLNRVVRIDESLPAGYNYNPPPLYAIVRRGSKGDVDVIIAIVDQDQYDKAIMDRRWTEQKPEKSKYRHPGEPEAEAEAEAEAEYEPLHDPEHEENLMTPTNAAQTPNGVAPTAEDPAILIVYYVYSDEPKSAQTLTARCKQSEMEMMILRLLGDGVLPSNIEVWQSVSYVQVGISLKSH